MQVSQRWSHSPSLEISSQARFCNALAIKETIDLILHTVQKNKKTNQKKQQLASVLDGSVLVFCKNSPDHCHMAFRVPLPTVKQAYLLPWWRSWTSRQEKKKHKTTRSVMTAREPRLVLDEQEVSLAARLCCVRRITLVWTSQTLWRSPECCYAQSLSWVSIYRVGIRAAVSGWTSEL